ncbi:MAG: SUMF1/EgtB/PvdO family nonheme iron enzyme [Gammaproteobacteria bacterium]|nr:SUMF1/EgtB/PvdO family nonheme iron enzyme [Gammaproteobacteria bacterium]MCY4282547.1 SUMF1/EgtB/PvdO family nonheme iron enzyme [Gammaproteobacteria bacterium]MCY4339290.1 SUMF1/EgtB/PvdO family nonheme iron enzyme [Gammaproteobacteria bacterium]
MRLTIIRTAILTFMLMAMPHVSAEFEAGQQAEATLSAQDTSQPPPQAIRAAQSLLAALGYQAGPADGVWTSSTKTAYQAFLRDRGLPQADTLTPHALRALQAAAQAQGIANAQPPAPSSANAPPAVSPDALHNAVQAGDINLLEALLATGVDTDARDDQSWTALMHAVNQGSPLLVSMLLEAQADVNVRALDGATALFMAVAHGHTEIIEMLMQAGADVSIRGPQGKTPTEVAITRYGDADAARESGVSPALLALLDGKTWVEVQVEQERQQREADIARRTLTEEMVSIPGGEFRMGRRRGKGDEDEKPVRTVTIPAFKLGKHEVTFAQWDACVTDGGCDGYTPGDEGWGRGNRPVINVSWDDVQSFIEWLNKKTGGNYRLPTEAEWEYAARAGTKTKYSWGNDIGSNRANCDNDSCGDSYEHTAPVGSFSANPWGLHDMHGNVWEWVQDCWNDNYKGAPKDGSAWTSGDCSRRVDRGGGWLGPAGYLRSASRVGPAQLTRSNDLGFRLAHDE